MLTNILLCIAFLSNPSEGVKGAEAVAATIEGMRSLTGPSRYSITMSRVEIGQKAPTYRSVLSAQEALEQGRQPDASFEDCLEEALAAEAKESRESYRVVDMGEVCARYTEGTGSMPDVLRTAEFHVLWDSETETLSIEDEDYRADMCEMLTLLAPLPLSPGQVEKIGQWEWTDESDDDAVDGKRYVIRRSDGTAFTYHLLTTSGDACLPTYCSVKTAAGKTIMASAYTYERTQDVVHVKTVVQLLPRSHYLILRRYTLSDYKPGVPSAPSLSIGTPKNIIDNRKGGKRHRSLRRLSRDVRRYLKEPATKKAKQLRR